MLLKCIALLEAELKDEHAGPIVGRDRPRSVAPACASGTGGRGAVVPALQPPGAVRRHALSLLHAIVVGSGRDGLLISQALRLRRVLCALDLERSVRAPLAHAGWFSQELGVPLDGLYVAAPLGEWRSRLERVRRLIADHQAQERLDALLAPFASSVDVQSFVTRGASGDVISAHASRHGADLIVLGGGKNAAACASKLAASLSGCAERGVLTVPGDADVRALRKILLPVTNVTPETPALAWVTKLARRFGATVELVGVNHSTRGFWRGLVRSRVSAEPKTDVQLALQTLEQRLLAAGVTAVVATERLRWLNADALLESGGYDLVVVGLPGQARSVESVLLDDMRKNGRVPVLSIRASAPLASGMARSCEQDWQLSASA